MEIEDHIGDELVDHQSDSELTLKLNPMLLTDEPTSENGIRIVLQEGTQSNKIVPLDDKQISDLYNCLGIPTDESNTKYATWRLNVIHIRGVQEMNTNDVLEFFNDFEPDSIEWVNDLSCNVLFADNRAAATALEGLTVALIVHKSQDDSDGIPENTEVIDASEMEYSVPPGNRWKLGKSHDKAKYLLLRFATTADEEMPEAHKDNEPMEQGRNDSIEEKSLDEEKNDSEKNDQDTYDSLEKSAEMAEDDEANSEEADEGVTRKRGRLVLDDDEDEDEEKNDQKADDDGEDQDSIEKAIGDESEDEAEDEAEDGRVKKKRRLIVDDEDDGDEEKEDADKDKDEKDEEDKEEDDDLAEKSAGLKGEGGHEAEGDGEGDGEEAGESSKIKDPAVPDLSSDEESDDDGKRRSKVPDDFVYDFDLMMAKKKEESYRSRKRKNIDIINDNDDIIADLITQMKQSADEDFELNKNRKAATCKLRLLPVVETQLRKIDLRESFLDAGVLGVITDWLTPLPDRSLPNLQVRECMLKLLGEFNIMDVERLKASGIGKAVMYLYKHPKETKDNKKRAGVLISSWSRPIFSLDSDFHTMSKEEREQRDFDHMNKLSENKRGRTEPKTPPSSGRKTQPESEKTLRPGDKGWVPRARVPAPSTRDYVVRPKSNVDSEMSRSGSKKAITRLDKHLRNFREKKKLMKTQRAVPISIEGRRMTL